MTGSVHKITLSASRDIPFNKLILSQANVRRIKAGVSIEELAEDIARRTLLQSLTVRAVVDGEGVETGIYEIPAGGRRYRALELLVKHKRLAKTAPIPCVVREGGIAEEDSLAENIQRAPLHPLDQFRAFLKLREKGQSEEEIAAAFFVGVAVVRQRLRLASVSPKLLEAYGEDAMTLDQLMAFTVNADHERQEQVFDRLAGSYTREPYAIRRMLTEGAVRACDKRAQFVGLDAYTQAGGAVMRDLFQGDDGGWLQDVGLLDRLVAEKLEREAEGVRAEGWKWIEVAPDFPYGHTYTLRQLRGEPVPFSGEEEAAGDALRVEMHALEIAYGQDDELPETVDQRLAEIETALTAIDERPIRFEADDVGRAGAFISIDGSGRVRIERGYVRPQDEAPAPVEAEAEVAFAGDEGASGDGASPSACEATPIAATVEREAEEDEGLKAIPDRLMTELTAHRTLALRQALAETPDVAFLAALHVVCLKVFYPYGQDACLELDLRTMGFAAQAPGLLDSDLAAKVSARHQAWSQALPKDSAELWDVLVGFETDSRQALFAHCVSLSVNAVYESYNRRPRGLAQADKMAAALGLDMVAAGWTASVANYLGRVTKARILAAVREARGEPAAERIAHMKKEEMAEAGEALLAGSGWLPEPLRTPGQPWGEFVPVASEPDAPAEPATDAVTAIAGGESAMAEIEVPAEEELPAFDPHAVAAE